LAPVNRQPVDLERVFSGKVIAVLGYRDALPSKFPSVWEDLSSPVVATRAERLRAEDDVIRSNVIPL
jgi:hypothetical protein